MYGVAVVGGGPAGMMAAIAAAQSSPENGPVLLLEKNDKPGRKLYITGKGRCNVTNNTDIPGLMAHVLRNPRFLYSAFHALDATGLMQLLEGLGVPLKTERGNRVFPESDKASHITAALQARMKALGVQLNTGCAVHSIAPQPPGFALATQGGPVQARAVVVATGGLSYPGTGSTGAGYAFAQSLGHTVTPTHPSLVGLTTAEDVADLEGLSLRNVRLTARDPQGAVLYEELGEMLFTATGVSGPLVLSASAYLAGRLGPSVGTPQLAINLKPGLSPAQLDARILRDFAATPNKTFSNALAALLPQRLVAAVVQRCGVAPHTPVHSVTRAQRAALCAVLHTFTLTPTATGGYPEAVITCGGVAVNELHPSTLMSKKVPGLFFAGEVLDVDALTGGFNLQIAFSTGYLAGCSV